MSKIKETKRVKLSLVDDSRGTNFKGNFHDGSEVWVEDNSPVGINVTTERDSYTLSKHPTMNVYVGRCNGTKVHVSLKKLVGELRYWS